MSNSGGVPRSSAAARLIRGMVSISAILALVVALPVHADTIPIMTTAPGPDDSSSGSAPAPPSTVPVSTSSPISRTTLPNGMRIVVKNEPGSPLTAVDVFVKVGGEQETPQTAGIGNFVAETLLASTGSRSPDVIQSEIADLGGNVQVSRQPDWTYISSLTVPDKFDDLMSLLSDVLKDATFDSDAVETQRTEILGEIDNGESSVFDRVYNNLRGDLFSDTGYGLPSLGTARTIQRMPQEQLLRYYREYFIPKNIVFVVVGDVDPSTAVDTITRDMENYDPTLRGSRRKPPAQTPLPLLSADLPAIHDYDTDLDEICVMAGFRAPSMASTDYPAIQVMNALLGGMKTSRLFTSMREDQGLSYDLGSFYSPQLYSGDLTVYAFAAPQHFDPATKKSAGTLGTIRDQILQQIADFQAKPPTNLELERAKHYLIGSYKIKHERIEDRATFLGIAELTSSEGAQADIDYPDAINAVTLADVERVAGKYLVHPVISTIEPDPRNGGVESE